MWNVEELTLLIYNSTIHIYASLAHWLTFFRLIRVTYSKKEHILWGLKTIKFGDDFETLNCLWCLFLNILFYTLCSKTSRNSTMRSSIRNTCYPEAVSRGVQGGGATPLSKSGGFEGPPCASHPPDFLPPPWLIIRGVQGTPL